MLWDQGFEYIHGPGDLIRRGDINRAKRLLGLATRRELASPDYWQRVLSIEPNEFDALLAELGVRELPVGGRLPKKAIHRLGAEARRRGSSPYAGVAADVELPSTPASSESPLEWEEIGHTRPLRFISDEQVAAIHFALVEDFLTYSDPIEPAGIRSTNLLASALYRPHTAIDGVLKYPTVEMAGAALLHSMVLDHPFHNGNKRTGVVALLVFLDENGFMLMCDEDELFRLVIQLAQHVLVAGPRHELADREALAIARWLKSNSRLVETGDRPLPWRRLTRILTQYNCDLSFPPGGGRVNISRTVEQRSRFLGRPKTRDLRTQLHYVDDNRDVDQRLLHKLRHDLELDEAHGIDSRAFYDHAPASPGEFIVKYRKTLRRLARL